MYDRKTKMPTPRRSALTTIITLLFLWFTALAGAADMRKEVIFWGQSFGPDTKGFEATIREFEKRWPEYKVRVLSMGAGRMNPQKLMTAIVGNVPPDVIYQDRFTLSDWANRGAFMALDDLLARDKGKDPFTPDLSKYVPATVAEATFDGKLYGIPFGCDTRVLYWNRKIFREESENLRKAGLDPTRPPRTWSEVLAYSKVLTKFNKSGAMTRAGFLPNYGNSWLYLYAFQNNAQFISKDGRTCHLDSPEAEEALSFMVKGYDIVGGYENAQKFQASFRGNEFDPFYTGQVVMKIDGDWILPGFLRFAPGLDFGVAKPPVPDDRYNRVGRFAGEKDQFVTWAGGFSWAIPQGARNVEGGWQLIKWLQSAEARVLEFSAQAEWEKRRGREFVPRILANIVANEQAFALLKPKSTNVAAALREHIDVSAVARIRPVTFVGQVLWNEHVRAVDQAGLKVMTVKAALVEGQTRVQKELDAEFEKEKYPVVDMAIPGYLGGGAALLALIGGIIGFKRSKLGKLERTEALWGYAFISPWLIGFLVFTIGPMVASLYFSFTQYNVLTPARWVGMKNYADMFALDQERVLKGFANILYLGGIGVPLGLVTGLAVAMMLNTGVKGLRVYRTVYYLPAIVPSMAATILWIYILSPDASRGIVNGLWLQAITPTFGVQPPGWTSVESWAKPALIFMGLWGAGSGMLLWLAALKGISSTLYEAAGIDGATPRQQFFSITLPMLSPVILFSTIMGFIGAMNEFDRVYVISNGEGYGPNDTMLVPVYYLFQNAFQFFKMGYASALAWVIFLIILAITLFQLWVGKKVVYSEVSK